MNPVKFTLQLAAASANNLAQSQTPTSGVALTLNGSAAAAGLGVLDVARRVLLTYGNEGSARTLVITGSDRYGNTQTETLAVPSGASGTLATERDFKIVSRAMPAGGGWTAAVTLGTNTVASTPWITKEWARSGKLGVAITIGATATVSAAIELTWDDPEAALNVYPYGVSFEPTSRIPPLPIPAPGFGTVTTTAIGNIDLACYAWRATVNSGVDPVSIQVIETQPDRKGDFA